MKKCVACAESIQAAALLCRYCGTDQRDERFSQISESESESGYLPNSSDFSSTPDDAPELVDSETPTNRVSPQFEEPSVVSFCTKCGTVIPRGERKCTGCLSGKTPQKISYATALEASPISEQHTPMNGRLKLGLVALASIVVLIGAYSQFSSGSGGVFSSGKYSASAACTDLSQTYRDYFDEFNAFRYSADDGTGWTKLDTLTNKAKGRIANSISRIRDGIDWDSSAVASGLLSDVSADMSEIVTSAKRGSFAPGRSLDGILNEINTTLYSVANSACN